MTNAFSTSVPPVTLASKKPEDATKPRDIATAAVDDEHEIEPEIEQDRIPEGTQLTPYKFPLNVDDVSAWQELLDASAGDEQAQEWYKSMLQQAEERAAAAEPAAAAPFPKPPKPTGIAAMMDDKNRAMLEVMQKKGPQAAMKAMMDAAGGDYAEMRMMYG
jgi:hypothetical protein